MKFTNFVSAFLVFALPVFALPAAWSLEAEPVTYALAYGNASTPLTEVACSNGANGLISKGYTTLGSLPSFPNVGGVYTVTGWNSPACGTCYNLSFANNTISVLAVDYAAKGFDVSETAMNNLLGGPYAYEYGTVEINAVQVNASYCGL